jgi:hypothetical protein
MTLIEHEGVPSVSARRAEKEVATIQPTASAVSETAAIISMIERAARDPAIDIDKLKQLMEMRERVESRQAAREYNEAMAACQAEMRPVAADCNNTQTKSKYASYSALYNALQPIYSKHGFSLSFGTADGAPEGHIRVTCKVSHGGFSETTHIDMPADGKGAKGGDVMTKTHATGAAISYGQRYLLKMIFNIAVGNDRDGNAPGGTISDEQCEALAKLIDDLGANEERFLKFLGVEKLADLPARQYDRATAALNDWGRKQRMAQQ